MNKDRDFVIYDDLNIDYNFLGTYPPNIDKMTNEQILDYFLECFKLTFSNTVFAYYGDIKEIKTQIKESLIKDELEFESRTNKEKWCILLLVVLNLFYVMHNTFIAQDAIEDFIDSFDMFNDEERLSIIHDFNFALYFGIEECMVVSPSKISDLGASDDDVVLLHDLIEKKDFVQALMNKHIKKKDLDKEHFEEFMKISPGKNYLEDLYDCLISMWIDTMEDVNEEALPFINNDDWQELSAEVFALLSTFFALTVNGEDRVFNVSEELYYFLMKLFKDNFKVKCEICEIKLE